MSEQTVSSETEKKLREEVKEMNAKDSNNLHVVRGYPRERKIITMKNVKKLNSRDNKGMTSRNTNDNSVNNCVYSGHKLKFYSIMLIC